MADDYRKITQDARKGDFIYLDPPYQPLNKTSNFTGYTPDGFGRENQVQLAKVYRIITERGREIRSRLDDRMMIK